MPVRPTGWCAPLAGISMDIGMSLLVLNLMLTALTATGVEALRRRGCVQPAPPRRGGAAP